MSFFKMTVQGLEKNYSAFEFNENSLLERYKTSYSSIIYSNKLLCGCQVRRNWCTHTVHRITVLTNKHKSTINWIYPNNLFVFNIYICKKKI
ncbi:hypothetical protein GDO86_017325 [Hymenochirus boettgeri]|uniref:SWIM-type domain-containing protein n=1 Tax=Hymenochirus boettgeri TaxID=247094 RepID=A0A8T2IRB8_9PIPI|nr:hypothetical protein GDO86_017325 [Hymenochirus boettgeri]